MSCNHKVVTREGVRQLVLHDTTALINFMTPRFKCHTKSYVKCLVVKSLHGIPWSSCIVSCIVGNELYKISISYLCTRYLLLFRNSGCSWWYFSLGQATLNIWLSVALELICHIYHGSHQYLNSLKNDGLFLLIPRASCFKNQILYSNSIDPH